MILEHLGNKCRVLIIIQRVDSKHNLEELVCDDEMIGKVLTSNLSQPEAKGPAGFFQSRVTKVAAPPKVAITLVFCWILKDRLDWISGRSVKTTWHPKMAAVAIPTRPVPEPSLKDHVSSCFI